MGIHVRLKLFVSNSEYRRKKVASSLFDELEHIASKTSDYIGLGVGLYKDNGYAQRMYTSRGYVMDGNGLTYKNVHVPPGKPTGMLPTPLRRSGI